MPPKLAAPLAANPNSALSLAFDVGHSSIGWAVLTAPETEVPDIVGCGVVLFEKDSALANQRRLHRQQRRHVRATRLRIARLEKLLVHIGAFSPNELAEKHRAAAGHGAPWLLAARVLASNGSRTLTWPELWDVLRWYAHNRGYEDMGADSDQRSADEKKQDTEKVENAKQEMARFGKTTMAETICAWLGLNPMREKIASLECYKSRNCAFERSVVVDEVRRILDAHRDRLAGLDASVIGVLLDDARMVTIPSIPLPRRYRGSLLFGRLATRYHNRIIGRCPISGGKLPSKSCVEFLRYRWAMQMASIRVASSSDGVSRPLSASERAELHARMMANGYLTPGELKAAVAALPGIARHNIEQLLLHPDAAEALVLDPVQKLISGNDVVSALWPHLPDRLQRRTRGRWRRGRSTTLGSLRDEIGALGDSVAEFDAALDSLANPPRAKGRPARKTPPPTRADLLAMPLDARRDLAKLSGRAPYARSLLEKAYEDVLAGLDPKASGGCLEETEEVRKGRESRPVSEQTNNHLVRHRLHILGRLLSDLIADPAYVNRAPRRICRITIEVNRDLREMAGLTAQDIAKELGARIKQHADAVKWLESDPQVAPKVTAGLIRKARVALDLGRRCPYTDTEMSPVDLLTKRVDLDHIIPRSQRQSDSLDSLAITYSAVNRWKGQRTAWQFIQAEGGKPVPDAPHLSIVTPARFRAIVEHLDTRGHADDFRRKKRRKEFLLLEQYEEKSKGFTPGQLTQTSQLARLAAQVVRRPFADMTEPPPIVALPGSVTGTVRRGWDLLGCLAAASPGVLEPDGSTKTKTEIREITHLHHALDACVIGLAAHLIPNRGDVWRLLAERRLRSEDQKRLAELGLFDFDAQRGFRIRDLPNAIKDRLRIRLAERRVVQHVPADMSGIRVEENTRGIVERKDGRVFLQQRKRNGDGKRVINRTSEPEAKVVGLPRDGVAAGKLARLRGVRVIADNFGVAILSDETFSAEERFVIIPFARVWEQLRELKVRNGGVAPIVWRNGQVIELAKGKRVGRWRIYSIKNNTSGLALDLGTPESVKPTWINALLKSLLRDGARVIPTTFSGSACG